MIYGIPIVIPGLLCDVFDISAGSILAGRDVAVSGSSGPHQVVYQVIGRRLRAAT